MASTNKAPFENTKQVEDLLLNKDVSYEESQNIYRQWAEEGTYDKMLLDNPTDYNGLVKFTLGMKSLFPDPSRVRVLDIGAGTGLSGEKLVSVGYTNIDALEPCDSFVEIYKKKGIYKNVIDSLIGGETPLDVPNDTYDAVCIVGCFAPGHIPSSAIPEMVRIVKSGGYILNCMRAEYLQSVPDYKDNLVPLLDDLERQGRIQKIEWTTYPNHFSGKDGIRMIFKVL